MPIQATNSTLYFCGSSCVLPDEFYAWDSFGLSGYQHWLDKEFMEMMAFVRVGDTLIVESISRIARNTRDLLTIMANLTEKGVEFVSLKENIDTTTPHGRFMLTVFGALAELERESILERQREGIEIAKAEGKYKGRKPVAIDEAKFRSVCARWRAGEITATAAMKEAGLKPNTFYRRVQNLGL